jgi:hypothetical protein
VASGLRAVKNTGPAAALPDVQFMAALFAQPKSKRAAL